MRVRHWLSATLVVLFVAPYTVNAQTTRIVQPSPAAVLLSQMDVDIVAELAPGLEDGTHVIRFEVFNLATGARRLRVAGDLRSRRSLTQARIVWRIRNVRSGMYRIMLSVDDVTQDSVEVTVNQAPKLRLKVLSAQPSGTGGDVTLQAIAKDKDGDSIVEATWTAGDGSPATVNPDTATPFTHHYSTDGAFVLTAMVEDARGGRATIQRDVNIVRSTATVEVKKTTDCGCTLMSVYTLGGADSFVYCNPGGGAPPNPGCVVVANPAEGNPQRCPKNTTPYQCPLGPFSVGERGVKGLGWSFEINAQIDPKTNDLTKCTEGQVNRSDAKGNGVAARNPAAFPNPPGPKAAAALPFPNPPAGKLVGGPKPYPPAAGPDWGADDYTAFKVEANDGKRHIPSINRVRWLDIPRIDRTMPAAAGDSLADHGVFVSWVTGNLGTCWCEFEYDHSWTAAGGRAGPAVMTTIAGKNCLSAP